MPPPLHVLLSEAERHALEHTRDKHKLAYLRERAAAILKVADGSSVRQVALHGLLKPRDPDTVYGWVHRYLAEGIQGLCIRAGRGRKPAFSPSALDETPRPGDAPARGTARPPRPGA